MSHSVPDIDSRPAATIKAQVHSLLQVYVPEWQAADLEGGVSAALVDVFARYAELIIERLNRVPEKNLQAFLQLLGNAPLPPQPARVPLTFQLAVQSGNEVIVAAGTQVAAPPGAGIDDPIVFETERLLAVVPARLTALFVREPALDNYADRSGVLAVAGPLRPESVFTADRAIPHVLYLSHNLLFKQAGLDELTLHIELQSTQEPVDPRQIIWDIWDGNNGIPLQVASDGTAGLTRTGRIHFVRCAPFPEQRLDDRRGYWLRCRLLTPITMAGDRQEGRVRASQLPVIKSIGLQAQLAAKDQRCESLFANQLLLDPHQALLPFGSEPKFGDAFYIGCSAASALAGTAITMHVTLVNPRNADTSPVPKVVSAELKLRWEAWDGVDWVAITLQSDSTGQFTQSGVVKFTLPVTLQNLTLQGVENLWVRVRMVNGNYGGPATIELLDPPGKKDVPRNEKISVVIPATYAPPLIARLTFDYALLLPETVPDLTLVYNDCRYTEVAVGEPAGPFRPSDDTRPTLYLAFTLAGNRQQFPAQPISLYVHVAELAFGRLPDNPAAQAPPSLLWEYSTGHTWSPLPVRDGTRAFTESGLLEFLAPTDFTMRQEFGVVAFWLRVSWVGGDYAWLPRIDKVLLNTTLATQARTVRDEIVGSSDGSRQQIFQPTQGPVLEGQQLAVRETAGLPGAVDVGAQLNGDRVLADPGNDHWIAWQPVTDFHGSGAQDRHYVLDRQSGRIRFGDGLNGRIPPIGVGNIRLTKYQAGGGSAGNVAAGTVTQLLSSVPFVDRVVNLFAAQGGTDAESAADFLARAPQGVRHQGYAVSLQDYEDLARLATPEVARVKGVMLFDLARDPDGIRKQPGTVSLIVVPRQQTLRPVPSLELISKIERYLSTRRSPLAKLVVVGPEYVRVDLEADIVAASLEATATLVSVVTQALHQFLHPLTGGPDGRGWRFGRKPHRSDLFVVLTGVPGVDHVQRLQVTTAEERSGVSQTGRFLVYSGEHRIRVLPPDLPSQQD